jgi:hypothetical protein
MQINRSNRRKVLACGRPRPLSRCEPGVEKRQKTAALQDAGALILLLTLATLFFSGCATAPRAQLQQPANAFPADALITQRAVLTVFGGRQFTLNGYLARSATNGQRLVVTENFGNVLADVLVTPDGKAHVMKSSRAFKPQWIERYLAADVRCLFGPAPEGDCPGQILGPNHFLITRRWYKLDVQIVEIKPGRQPAAMFDSGKLN